jgi:phosphoserine phosphatase RsbU/P
MPARSEQFRYLLLDRREVLVDMMGRAPENPHFLELSSEIDSALERLNSDQYGICEVCGKAIDDQDLVVNPLLRQCISHLPPDEQRQIFKDQGFAESVGGTTLLDDVKGASQQVQDLGEESTSFTTPWMGDSRKQLDLDIHRARLIESELLPASHLRVNTWDLFYEYIPAGALGGDYCDIVRANNDELFLFFGDAMGKGIAASMIVARLHTLFRTLLGLDLPLVEMLERANRIFCECVLASGYYATIVCGRAHASGVLEVVNAGHLPPLLLSAAGAERVLATGLPLGLFYASKYEVTQIQLKPGETLLFYTDGITEARDISEIEYGHERLATVATVREYPNPEELVHACHKDVTAFTSKTIFSDDLTLLAIRRVSPTN